MNKNSFLLLLLCLACSCCPTEDIITVDIKLSHAFFRNYSSQTFEELPDNTGISFMNYTIVPQTEIDGLEGFEEPNRRFLQSPDCDISDPDYNLTDPVVRLEVIVQTDYNEQYLAGSDMSEAFYSVFLNDNPLRPSPEVLVHGGMINIDSFNSHFISHHDAVRRGQEPFKFYGLKPAFAPSNAGLFTFEIIIHLQSGIMISSITAPMQINP